MSLYRYRLHKCEKFPVETAVWQLCVGYLRETAGKPSSTVNTVM